MFIRQHSWLYVMCLITNIALLYVLACVRSASRKVPQNFILLGLFTLTEAYLVSCMTIMYDPTTVFIAAMLTAGIVIALTIYACTTKTDFTIYGGLLFTILMAFMLASIFSFFFRNQIFRIVLSAVSVVLFSIYLIYDTQLILGKGELKLTVDDYVFAAITLYIDIIQIFISILRLVGSARN